MSWLRAAARAWLCACCIALLSLWPRGAGALQQTSRVLPEGALIVPWAGDPAVSRLVDATRPVELGSGEVLLIPIDPGDRVRVVAERDHWTVLTAPGGQVYCLTDRDPATGVSRPV